MRIPIKSIPNTVARIAYLFFIVFASCTQKATTLKGRYPIKEISHGAPAPHHVYDQTSAPAALRKSSAMTARMKFSTAKKCYRFVVWAVDDVRKLTEQY
jgi:hypothetical protein